MKLEFNNNEICAIYKVAKMMAEADGVVFHEELKGIEDEMTKLGVNGTDYDKVVLGGERLEAIEAFSIIHDMDIQKKKYVSAFLGYFISVDDDIADAEMALWSFIIQVCNLPKMNIRQAVDIYRHS